MTSIKNTARALKVGQIEKNPILALGTSEKDVEKYGRIARAYGNVAPAIVGQSGKRHLILAGQAGLEACARQGIHEIPVVVAEIDDEAEQMKLALLLSTVRADGCPLSEGAFIDVLTTRHGVTRRELMRLLKKSKSWVSKRQSLTSRLSEAVQGMVKDGVICARAAEEIAKMPKDAQVAFASVVVRDGLNKTNVGRLVRLYTRADADSAPRAAILDAPLAVLDMCPAGPIARREEKRGLTERITGGAGSLIRLVDAIKKLLTKADARDLALAAPHLAAARAALGSLSVFLDELAAKVSPGKPQEGDAS
jgi:ParB-like chromosome segregation protein Spo0J